MYVVMTRVKLKDGTHEDCAALFRESNPHLVKDEPDWLDARMMFDPESGDVTVLATWRNIEAYRRLSGSEEFQQVMQKFGQFFAGPPEISVHDLLVDMLPK